MKIPWFSGYLRLHHSFAEERVFDFEKSRSLENEFLSMWFAPNINANMVDIMSFFCNLKEQNYVVLLYHRTKLTD